MKIINKFLVFSMAIIAVVVVTACEDHQARYEAPTWLEGSSIDILESNEDYSIYLNLLKRSDFYKSVNTISYTLFVPDNDAFQTYFDDNGISVNFTDGKLDTILMTDEETYQLFSLHLLVNPRARNDLIYENAFGQIEDENYEYASLFFKKQTPSLEAVYKDFPTYNETFFDSVPIYSTAKYIPVWSKEYLEDVFSPLDGSDYEYLYSNTNSDYDSESELSYYAMNWGNAKMLPDPNVLDQLGIKTSSGFIYPLDQVVEPLPTIEKFLLQNLDKYGVFYDLLQRFANYGNAQNVEVEIDGELIVQEQYKKLYTNSIASIADERGPKNAPWGVFYMKDYFTAFIPTDDVLNNYLENTLLSTFENIDSVPELTLSYFIRAHFINTLGLVSKMEKGIFDNFGTPIVINRDEINSATMCSNGGFYEMNKVMEPYAFTAITEDLFFDQDYSVFLYMLVENNLLTDLISKGDEVTLFASTNDELLAANIRYDPADGNIYYYGIDEVWRIIKSDHYLEFLQNHIAYSKTPDLSGEGFIKMSSGNVVHYNNGIIEGPLNQFLGTTGQATELKETDAGIMYHTDIPITSRNYSVAKLLHNDVDPEYEQTLTDTTLTEFSDLLADNRLLNYRIKDLSTGEYKPLISFLGNADEWTVIAPTNEAIREARAEGYIPSDRDSLSRWLQYHFIPANQIFDDGNPDGTGTFKTFMTDEIIGDVTIYETIEINNATNNLQLTDKTGQVVNVEHSMANMLAQKGVVHKINKVLKSW
ncbi:MAG: fasciclin domain-containing protein [Bacteroidales bacterium]|nr:fasciclin domain-containing protein [Bacteroidales bacterium]